MQQNSVAPLIIAVVLGLALYAVSVDRGNSQNLAEVRDYGNSLEKGTGKDGAVTATDIEKDIKSVERSIQKVGEELTSLIEEKNRSPYADTVSIKGVSGLGSVDPKKEYVTISLSQSSKENVTISGWQLKSDSTGKSVAIGKGAAVYYPNTSSQNDFVVLLPGNTAVITTGMSPLGLSFKTNKCTGYLNQFNSFSPTLPQQCPLPENEDLRSIPYVPANFSCFDFIERMSRCRLNTKPLPVTFSSECVAFIYEKVGYQGCLSLHRNDSDFFGTQWRIYLGRNESLWLNKRETIRLIDENGKTVDTYARR
ncbi:MAG: hypothetical protein U1D31_02575 [Patescibacteria group bacterium]|nr:hypothetical protein [bacterium]MDZ4240982.1 hypothetical protein [Patescibacteria group bacterium]